jgi:hypothetical protein
MTLRKKIANEREFGKVETLFEFLSGFRFEMASENNPFPASRIFQMLHQSEIIKLALDAALYVRGLPDIESFKSLRVTASEDVDAGASGSLSSVAV